MAKKVTKEYWTTDMGGEYTSEIEAFRAENKQLRNKIKELEGKLQEAVKPHSVPGIGIVVPNNDLLTGVKHD